MELPEQLRSILSQEEHRTARAKRIARLIRKSSLYRWVGIYSTRRR
jgi:putative methionine-R-sulfoxide reductase with GAF domain